MKDKEKFDKLFQAVLDRRRVRKAIESLGDAETLLVFTDFEKAKEIQAIQKQLRETEKRFFELVESERVKFSGEEIEKARELFYKLYHQNL